VESLRIDGRPSATIRDMTLEFSFNGREVGYFTDGEFPKAPGRYRYEPYRGPGHYQMQTLRHSGGTPRCSYDDGKQRVLFTVLDCPVYGVLELADFEFVN